MWHTCTWTLKIQVVTVTSVSGNRMYGQCVTGDPQGHEPGDGAENEHHD